MDIVYVAKQNDQNEELRYSLRSLANLPHDRVWVAGHRPFWVRNADVIPTWQHGTKWENSTANLLAACEHPEVSEDFVLFNDDFFVMEPLDTMPTLHRGPIEAVQDYYSAGGESRYLHGMKATAALLALLGLTDLLSYELHVPMVFNKTRCAEVLRLPQRHELHIPVLHKRTLYGNYYRVGGAQVADVKVSSPSQDVPPGPFLSTNDRTFTTEPIGRHIRSRFPRSSPYEA